MKAAVVIFLFVFCYVECRKIVPPVDKSANIAFINMEGGGAGFDKQRPKPNVGPTPKPVVAAPAQPAVTAKPVQPAVTAKPIQPQPTLKPQQPAVGPMKPQQAVPPVPVSTPGPGSVKQLVTFYDSQGKGSVIRPFSYADAVKKNKS